MKRARGSRDLGVQLQIRRVTSAKEGGKKTRNQTRSVPPLLGESEDKHAESWAETKRFLLCDGEKEVDLKLKFNSPRGNGRVTLCHAGLQSQILTSNINPTFDVSYVQAWTSSPRRVDVSL